MLHKKILSFLLIGIACALFLYPKTAVYAADPTTMNYYIQKYRFGASNTVYSMTPAKLQQLRDLAPYVGKAVSAYNKRFKETMDPQLVMWWTASEGTQARTHSNCANVDFVLHNCIANPTFWQLGPAGIQFAFLGYFYGSGTYGNNSKVAMLKLAFQDMHGDPNNAALVKQVGQSVLDYDQSQNISPKCGGYSCTYPSMTIDTLLKDVHCGNAPCSGGAATMSNWWASVLVRDPGMSAYIQARGLWGLQQKGCAGIGDASYCSGGAYNTRLNNWMNTILSLRFNYTNPVVTKPPVKTPTVTPKPPVITKTVCTGKNIVWLNSASTGEFNPHMDWIGSQCSQASLAEIINAYKTTGQKLVRIEDIEQHGFTTGVWSPDLGFLGPRQPNWIKEASDYGFNTVYKDYGANPTQANLSEVINTANSGHPVIVSAPNHYLIIWGGDSTYVYTMDSSGHDFTWAPHSTLDSIAILGPHDRYKPTRAEFLHGLGGFATYWTGLSIVLTPKVLCTSSVTPTPTPTQQTTAATPPPFYCLSLQGKCPTPTETMNPCAGLNVSSNTNNCGLNANGVGLFCGGNCGVAGDAGTLYQCKGNTEIGVRKCSTGCMTCSGNIHADECGSNQTACGPSAPSASIGGL